MKVDDNIPIPFSFTIPQYVVVPPSPKLLKIIEGRCWNSYLLSTYPNQSIILRNLQLSYVPLVLGRLCSSREFVRGLRSPFSSRFRLDQGQWSGYDFETVFGKCL